MTCRATPLVVISNTLETNAAFFNREPDLQRRSQYFQALRVASARSLLWLGRAKLAVVETSVAHWRYLVEHLGYSETEYAVPAHLSDSICLDILADAALLQRLVDYASPPPQRCLQLVPFATTPQFLQLVEVLQTQHQLQVSLPESPAAEALSLRDYIQTKLGFRLLVQQWLSPTVLAPGYVTDHIETAAAMVTWFCRQGQDCVVKPATGCWGLGQTVFRAAVGLSLAQIQARVRDNPFLSGDLIVVEAWIESPQALSPSVEVRVPPLTEGLPQVTHVCNQLLQAGKTYSGELVSRQWRSARWYTELIQNSLQIARQLQALGYKGHFDIDSIVDAQGRLYLLELNARRTGGTHVHELAQFLLGEDYLDRVTVLSQGALPCGAIADFKALQAAIAPLLYPIHQQPHGVVITHTADLPDHRFGCIILGTDLQDVLRLQQQLLLQVTAKESS